MVADGIGSMIGALCGSPYGTTVYIGHPAYKKMGAGKGYSLLNGCLYLLMGWTGLHAFLNALIPHEAVLGIIAFVGLSIASQACELCPRWYPAFFAGAVVAFTDWAGVSQYEPNAYDKKLAFLHDGYLFISLFLMLGLTTLTDRKFLQSASVWFSAAVCFSFGLIHSKKLGWPGSIEGKDTPGMPGWKFVCAYLGLASICLVMHVLQGRGLV